MSFSKVFSFISGLLCFFMIFDLSAGEVENRSLAADSSLIIDLLKRNSADLSSLKRELAEVRKEIQDLRRARASVLRKRLVSVDNLKLKKSDHVIGSSKAPVAIVEFSDYQCPFCARFYSQTYPVLRKEYIDTGKVKLISKDFPLGFHAKAESAARAANCAAEQDAYEAMRLRLFKENRRLGKGLYMRLARDLALDMDAFEACMRDESKMGKISDDIADGKRLGVKGTPSFFIGRAVGDEVTNVTNLRGAQPYKAFVKMIDKLLN